MTMSVNDYHHRAQNKNSKSGKPEQPESLGLSLSLSSQANSDAVGLNVDKLLDLFGGNRDNVDYFIGLWNACKLNTTRQVGEDGWDEDINVKDEEKCQVEVNNCDPRDLRKKGSIKDWSPQVTVSSEVLSGAGGVDEGQQVNCSSSSRTAAAVEDENGERYAAKQTVFDHGWGGEESGDSMEQLPQDQDTDSQRFPCGVHGCSQVSSSLASYEAHYRHCHSYVCDTCRRLFVSNFLLDIHLQENHDSYFAVLSPRIDMYRCLVESCDQKFRTPELRKDHLVAVHKFPSTFSFHQPVKTTSRSKRAQKSASSTHVDGNGHTGCEDGQSSVGLSMEMDVESTQQGYGSSSGGGGAGGGRRNDGDGAWQSQKKKIPSSICFGRGSQRAFQQRRGGGLDKGNNYNYRNKNKKGGYWYQQQPVTTNGGGGAGGENKVRGGSESETDATIVDIESVDMTDLADALSLPSSN